MPITNDAKQGDDAPIPAAPPEQARAAPSPAEDARLHAAPDAKALSGDEAKVLSARAEPAEAVLGLGARLRAARLAQGLTTEDIAALLKVGARKIEALEDERWELLPHGPYLRGLVRNYAKILKIDASGIPDELGAPSDGQEVPADLSLQPSLRTPFPQRSRQHESGLARLMRVGTLLFAVLAGLIAWSGTQSFQHSEEMMTNWLAQRAKPEAAALQGPGGTDAPLLKLSSEPAVPPPASPAEPAKSQPGAGGQQAASLALAALSAATPLGTSSQGPQALSGDLVMRFNDDSWVEVRQADGKILMSQLNHAGAGKALDGAPPLELVIGNAPAVALQYRGSAVDLAPYTRDRVAHITLK